MRGQIIQTLESVQSWHEEGRRHRFFDSTILPTVFEPDKWFVELAYWNYCGWHLIEEFPAMAMESMRVNRSRCEVMDRIDGWFMERRSTSGPMSCANTETFGSIVDRIINHRIKMLHLLSGGIYEQYQYDQLEKEITWLIEAAVQLDEDCASGRRYVFPFTRTKVGLPI